MGCGLNTGAWTALLLCLGVFALAPAPALAERDGSDLVAVTVDVSADSVTVGERFRITHSFTFPDSLRMLPARPRPPGRTLVVSASWQESTPAPGTIVRTRDTVAMTLDLAQALLPAGEVSFVSASGDTLRVPVEEVLVPVRHIAAQSRDLRPLKEQWEAPRDYTKWIIVAVVACALASLAWFLWRRRHRSEALPAPRVVLPPDYVALSELTRVERLGLLEQNEYKRYYTLVVDALRHYIEGRFQVEAMDRTTRELLDDMQSHADVPGLEELLVEADLVKFAKFVPTHDAGVEAMATARDIVVKTTPTEAPPAATAAGAR